MNIIFVIFLFKWIDDNFLRTFRERDDSPNFDGTITTELPQYHFQEVERFPN